MNAAPPLLGSWDRHGCSRTGLQRAYVSKKKKGGEEEDDDENEQSKETGESSSQSVQCLGRTDESGQERDILQQDQPDLTDLKKNTLRK